MGAPEGFSRVAGDALADGEAVWANSAAQDTEQAVPVARPAGWVMSEAADEKALLLVANPSTVTDLTVKYRMKWQDSAGGARKGDLETLAVPANSVLAFVVSAGLGPLGAEVALSNDTVLGAGDGFTAYVQVRQL